MLSTLWVSPFSDKMAPFTQWLGVSTIISLIDKVIRVVLGIFLWVIAKLCQRWTLAPQNIYDLYFAPTLTTVGHEVFWKLKICFLGWKSEISLEEEVPPKQIIAAVVVIKPVEQKKRPLCFRKK